jgi:hypothetical protein
MIRRRELGLTVPFILKMVQNLHLENEDEISSAEAAASLVSLMSKDERFQGLRDVDWEEILEFLIRIMPLILLLL